MESKEPLLPDDVEHVGSEADLVLQPRQRKPFAFRISIFLNVVLVTVCSFLAFSSVFSHGKPHNCQTIFSPAQDAIEYTTQVFTSGLIGDRSKYQGATDEVLQNWSDLYDGIAMNQIDKATAQKLPNATAPTSFDSSQYVVQLDVFHTLHCLNILRKRLYPDVYPPNDKGEDGLPHLEHCVDQIRQSLQCFGDVSTIFWEWDQTTQRMLGNTQSTHTCRNFEKIKDWAREHSLPQKTDFLVHVPGAPLKKVQQSG